METIHIDQIVVGDRARKDMGDLEPLAKSMQEVGLLHPVAIDANNKLLCGERRLEAAKRLGWAEIPVTVHSDIDTLTKAEQAEKEENTCRKDLLPSEMVARAARLRPFMEVEADKRKAEGQRLGGIIKNQGKVLAGKLPASTIDEKLTPSEMVDTAHLIEFHNRKEGKPAQTRDMLAAAVGTSGRTLQKMKTVVDAATEDPERFGEDLAEMDRTGKVSGPYNNVQKKKGGGSITTRKQVSPPAGNSKNGVSSGSNKDIYWAEQAINALRNISRSGPDRKRAFVMVSNYIKVHMRKRSHGASH